MAELPVACSLETPALARRQTELRAGLLSEAESVERLADGYRWQFAHAPDLFQRLGSIVDDERQCCRFLRFQVTGDMDRGTVTLDVTGPAGTADFLETWLPLHD
jgi:hypothetical protein